MTNQIWTWNNEPSTFLNVTSWVESNSWSTRLTCDPQPGRSPWLRMLRGNRLLSIVWPWRSGGSSNGLAMATQFPGTVNLRGWDDRGRRYRNRRRDDVEDWNGKTLIGKGQRKNGEIHFTIFDQGFYRSVMRNPSLDCPNRHQPASG